MTSPSISRLNDKVALITGVNDGGIGGAIARRLAREGAKLVLLSLEEPTRLMRRFDRSDTESLLLPCDITMADQVDQAIAKAVEQFDRIDIVVNNAGIDASGLAESMTDDVWEKVIDVNLTGAMRVTRAALPHFPSAGGAIVNIASALALGGCKGFTAYSATKAGLVGWSRSLAWELASGRIRVNCVAPALVATPMIARHSEQLDEAARQQIIASHPLGVGTPQDVAAAVAFLASDDARWITGVALPLGWTSGYALPGDALG